jgi:hypothetical protein
LVRFLGSFVRRPRFVAEAATIHHIHPTSLLSPFSNIDDIVDYSANNMLIAFIFPHRIHPCWLWFHYQQVKPPTVPIIVQPEFNEAILGTLYHRTFIPSEHAWFRKYSSKALELLKRIE